MGLWFFQLAETAVIKQNIDCHFLAWKIWRVGCSDLQCLQRNSFLSTRRIHGNLGVECLNAAPTFARNRNNVNQREMQPLSRIVRIDIERRKILRMVVAAAKPLYRKNHQCQIVTYAVLDHLQHDGIGTANRITVFEQFGEALHLVGERLGRLRRNWSGNHRYA